MAVTANAQEKQELFKTIWKIADDLRGKVDGWDFKSYVLGTLFYRYLSENITERINKQEHEAGDTEFDYVSLDDTITNVADYVANFGKTNDKGEALVEEVRIEARRRGFNSIFAVSSINAAKVYYEEFKTTRFNTGV